MRGVNELVEFLDKIYETWEFEEQHNEKSSPNNLVESEVMLTEIKWNLKEYEKLKKKHFQLCFEMNTIRHRLPGNDLIEIVTNIGESLGVRLGNQEVGSSYKKERTEAIAKIHKLLQSRQPEKPLNSKIKKFFTPEMEKEHERIYGKPKSEKLIVEK